MNLNKLRDELRKLSVLADGWSAAEEITPLERDLALEKLRRLYEVLHFGVAEQAPQPTPAAAFEEPAVTLDIDLGDVLSLDLEADEAPMPESEMPQAEPEPQMPEPESLPESEPVMPELESLPGPELVSSPEFEPASAPELVPVSVPASEPKPAEVPLAATLFGAEDETMRHRHKQRVIMSLYDTAPAAPEPARTPVPVSVPVPADEPAAGRVSAPAAEIPATETPAAGETAREIVGEPADPHPVSDPAGDIPDDDEPEMEEITVVTAGAVLGEVINHDRQTLADTLAGSDDLASRLRRGEPVGDLHRAIGINDKFLMIRDLFGGDSDAFEAAVVALNQAASLDDCVIHIAENYAWNPNSDGAKLMMDLLERKFT